MKYSTGIITIIALSAAFVLSGCDRPSNQTNQTDSADTSVMQSERDSDRYADNTTRDRYSDSADREVEQEVRAYRAENSERIMEY